MEIGFDGFILRVEVGHVDYQVLDHKHVREGGNTRGFGGVAIGEGETCETVCAINVHGARATDAFATGSTEGEGGILFVFDFQQDVEHHGATPARGEKGRRKPWVRRGARWSGGRMVMVARAVWGERVMHFEDLRIEINFVTLVFWFIALLGVPAIYQKLFFHHRLPCA